MTRTHDRAPKTLTWALASAVCMAVLSGPALWNGFALLQYDTGGYLARWYEGYLVPSRAVVYGLILNAGSLGDFWPVVLVQSAATVWIVALTLRCCGLGGRPFLLTILVSALSVFTTLPWLTSILLTDIFCGLGVLALALLLLGTLTALERAGLIALIAISAATHSATLAVLAAQLCAVPLLAWSGWTVSWPRIRDCILALALGVILVFTANFAIAGRLAWTPGGFALSFGRMLQDGIVDRYLADHCPDTMLRLCAYRTQLPRDADEFFWGNDIFISLGRFAGLGHEMERIALGSIAEYPALQIKTAAIAALKQLIDVRTGEGVVRDIWHTYAIIEHHTPWVVPAMKAARQQQNGISFDLMNRLHWPVALLGFVLAAGVAAGGTMRLDPTVRWLAAMTVAAILANALVCGVLSNPHDRYGARLAWLPPLCVALAVMRLRHRDGNNRRPQS